MSHKMEFFRKSKLTLGGVWDTSKTKQTKTSALEVEEKNKQKSSKWKGSQILMDWRMNVNDEFEIINIHQKQNKSNYIAAGYLF